MNPSRCWPAVLCVVALLLAWLRPVAAQEQVMVPDGGRLEAIDDEGNVMGPCPLRHTDVDVEIAGLFSRVTLEQTYHNPYAKKIEAVYTFPLSHRAAVDRMVMVIGDRVVEGEVEEREQARLIYEAARAQGYVASLLEQERPNIFTQSVANIEPGAEVVVRISYIELVDFAEGVYRFDFPMVVGPRYIPGAPTVSPALVPAELTIRRGLILLGPAHLQVGAAGAVDDLGTLQTGKLAALLTAARPIKFPGDGWWGRGDPTGGAGQPTLWYRFEARYCDESKELGELYTDGTGQINGRWFYTDPKVIREMGAGFAQDTNQVPDASRITPEPVRPGQRAGHDIALRVSLDTGGPGIVELRSELHEVIREDLPAGADDARRVVVELARKSELPNRDFVLSWRLESDTIQESILAHTRPPGVHGGGFFTLILQPPDRVKPETVRPRELVFVMDSSGSMNGFPIEKAKEVMTRAIDAMRPNDTFNVITFAGHTDVLWTKPKAASEANRAEAKRFVESRQGRGGTEMMSAMRAALEQPPTSGPRPMRIVMFLTDGYVGNDMAIIDAVQRNADTTRVCSFGGGNAVNRYLLDGLAHAGRGEAEYVLLESDADETVERFARRIQTPVLTDIRLAFSGDLEVSDVLPAAGAVPDLFDAKPLVVHGRYRGGGRGAVTVRGHTAAGPYERTIELSLPEHAPRHDAIATLWARKKVETLLNRDLAAAQTGSFPAGLKADVIALGKEFQ
ncbi:MAG: VIT domain-containing protein, partial [Planctomycetota bacterium]